MTRSFRRAVWMDIHRDIRRPEDAVAFVDWCGRHEITLAFPCVNHCTGFMTYPSDLAPRSIATDAWDPTAETLARCKDAGIESHVWVCIGNWGGPKIDPADLSAKGPRTLHEAHPDWFCTDQNSASMLDGDSKYAFVNPAREDVRAFHVKLCGEILDRYAFEGYHLDYIRYHFKTTKELGRKKEAYAGGDEPPVVDLAGSERLSFDEATLRAFDEESGIGLFAAGDDLAARVAWLYADEARREAWYAWKASQVTTLVRQLAKATRGRGRDLSAAVFSGYPWCGQEVAQRWPAWVDEKLLDLAVPMDYGVELDEYAAHLENQHSHMHVKPKPATPTISGIGIFATYKHLSPAEANAKLEKQEAIARAHNRVGVSLYCYSQARELWG